ncbi:hypothetical protein [Desulfocurvibacter africanus]|uniref:hypothetical protein n=1 Tax=Desulfocurvibacter africanus TaxID=873 RepID=UPI00047FF10B|nr:hypothetical protein [Desulfocurvibacter africanus]
MKKLLACYRYQAPLDLMPSEATELNRFVRSLDDAPCSNCNGPAHATVLLAVEPTEEQGQVTIVFGRFCLVCMALAKDEGVI